MTRNREDRLQGRIRLDGAPGVQVVLLDVHPDLLRHLRTYVAMSSIRHLDGLSSTFGNFRQLGTRCSISIFQRSVLGCLEVSRPSFATKYALDSS